MRMLCIESRISNRTPFHGTSATSCWAWASPRPGRTKQPKRETPNRRGRANRPRRQAENRKQHRPQRRGHRHSPGLCDPRAEGKGRAHRGRAPEAGRRAQAPRGEGQARRTVADKSLNAGIDEADHVRHFEYGGKIKRVHVTAAQLKALNAGELGVVQQTAATCWSMRRRWRRPRRCSPRRWRCGSIRTRPHGTGSVFRSGVPGAGRFDVVNATASAGGRALFPHRRPARSAIVRCRLPPRPALDAGGFAGVDTFFVIPGSWSRASGRRLRGARRMGIRRGEGRRRTQDPTRVACSAWLRRAVACCPCRRPPGSTGPAPAPARSRCSSAWKMPSNWRARQRLPARRSLQPYTHTWSLGDGGTVLPAVPAAVPLWLRGGRWRKAIAGGFVVAGLAPRSAWRPGGRFRVRRPVARVQPTSARFWQPGRRRAAVPKRSRADGWRGCTTAPRIGADWFRSFGCSARASPRPANAHAPDSPTVSPRRRHPAKRLLRSRRPRTRRSGARVQADALWSACCRIRCTCGTGR